MAAVKTLALVLTPLVHGSQVIVDGVDISSSVTGVEVRAMVGEGLQVTLYLTGRVELLADVEQLNCIRPSGPAPGDPGPVGEGTGA